METANERIGRTTDLPLPDGIWRVDARRSEIRFAVREMWGLRTVRGAFGACDGSLRVQADAATGELTIETASLDTGHRRRDRHLRSPTFFDVERHPRIVFAATAATARDGGLTIAGELAIGSSRVPLEMPTRVERTADGALRIEAETTIDRREAGLGWNVLGMIGGDAVLSADLTLERAAP